jgi:hypothetical protein
MEGAVALIEERVVGPLYSSNKLNPVMGSDSWSFLVIEGIQDSTAVGLIEVSKNLIASHPPELTHLFGGFWLPIDGFASEHQRHDSSLHVLVDARQGERFHSDSGFLKDFPSKSLQDRFV